MDKYLRRRSPGILPSLKEGGLGFSGARLISSIRMILEKMGTELKENSEVLHIEHRRPAHHWA